MFVTTGMAYFLLAIIYYIIDVKHWWGGEPFYYTGMNPLVIYLGRSSAAQMMPFNYAYGPMRTHWFLLPETIWGVVMWTLVGYVMYRNKVFIVV